MWRFVRVETPPSAALIKPIFVSGETPDGSTFVHVSLVGFLFQVDSVLSDDL